MIRKVQWLAFPGLACWLVLTATAQAQQRPYVGYAYPAGGQQGTTFQIRIGGQGLDDVKSVLITGPGVSARVVDYYRQLKNQDMQLLNEQLRRLKRTKRESASDSSKMMDSDATVLMSAADRKESSPDSTTGNSRQNLITRIEKHTREHVQTPACASIANLVVVEVTIAANAKPGERELRLATPRGVSNPLPFHVGQLPEFSRKPMTTTAKQILGKEEQALRKRPADGGEEQITLPCTVNGQIASGEVNRYRFKARKGQRLVIATQARQLIPYIADAVPGWIQPVLVLYDAQGKELAFADDYRFQPDPVILYEVPKDGEYVAAINDAIYRGREDFVYRISIGELPWVTSIFPFGAQAGVSVAPKVNGWNLDLSALMPPVMLAAPGIHRITADRNGVPSNPLPFAVDTLPERFEQESNDNHMNAQKITLPAVVNGRVDKPGDWDVFQFTGKCNDTVVAEVRARRLDSPLDSVIKLTDGSGKLIAFNDDREDLGVGVNTHQADSLFMARLPEDGDYQVHVGDTARQGGEEYGYRLRLSAPQPDFELRVVPSSIALRSRSTSVVTIYAIRKDGFTGPLKLALKNPPAGFSASPVTLSGTQHLARLTLRSDKAATEEPVNLVIVGTATIDNKEIAHEAVPAEDRMQAFLWRHLVTASDLKALVFNPASQPSSRRLARIRPPSMVATNTTVASATTSAAKPQFSKQQVAGRLRQLDLLHNDGLLADDFYHEKVAECEAAR